MGTGRRSNLFSRRLVAATVATVIASAVGAQAWAGNLPGTSRSTYYDVSETTGVGDNILRLQEPAGCGNGGVPNANCHSETDVCAMIYVFDDDQEMGECCGCPITPNELLTFSVKNNLTSNWGLPSDDVGNGVIVVLGAEQNNISTCNVFTARPVSACNDGCDPTFGYTSQAPDTVVYGSITHPQAVFTTTDVPTAGLTELPLFDDGTGDPVNNHYLINECASLIANSSGAGVCNCPLSDDTSS